MVVCCMISKHMKIRFQVEFKLKSVRCIFKSSSMSTMMSGTCMNVIEFNPKETGLFQNAISQPGMGGFLPLILAGEQRNFLIELVNNDITSNNINNKDNNNNNENNHNHNDNSNNNS